MVKEYLLKCKKELIEEKMHLMKELKKNELSIKENLEFVHYIEMSEDKSYDSFVPQSFEKDLDEKKLFELKEKKKELEQCKSQLEKRIEIIDHKLAELEQIIASIIIRQDEESESMYSAENDICSVIQNLNRINSKIKMCVDLVDVDRYRCKLELMNLSRYIDDILNEI